MSVSALGAAQTFAYSSAPSRPAASGGGGAVAAGHAQAAAPGGLSTADLKVVSELKARDQVVRAHEAAHLAAGAGIVTRGASFSYQTGPDGQRYAVGGEVGINTSPGRTPEETLAKSDRIRAAALVLVGVRELTDDVFVAALAVAATDTVTAGQVLCEIVDPE